MAFVFNNKKTDKTAITNFQARQRELAPIISVEDTNLGKIQIKKNEVEQNNNNNTEDVIDYKTLPLDNIFSLFEAEKITENKYIYKEQSIIIKAEELKWYNTDIKKGGINAINLTMHLLALKNGITIEELTEKRKEYYKEALQYIGKHISSLVVDNKKLENNQPPVLENVAQSTVITEPHYNNVPISTLENSGVSTQSLIQTDNYNFHNERPVEFDPKKIPLVNIISLFGGKQTNKPNKFLVLNQEISIKPEELKWYNITLKKGSINSLNLTKHLLGIQKGFNLDEIQENSDALYKAAVKLLTNKQAELLSYQQEATVVNSPVIEANNKPSQPEEVKQATPALEEKIQPSTPITSQDNVEASREAIKARNKAIRDYLNDVPLYQVFEILGAHPNADNDRNKWKFYQTGHNINLNNQLWNNWNTQERSAGTISFLKHYYSHVNNLNLNDEAQNREAYKLSIAFLMENFGKELEFDEDFSYEAGSNVNNALQLKVPFALPHNIPFKIHDVQDYLHEQRGIPNWVITKQIKTGLLYAGYPSDWTDNPKIRNPKALKNEDVWAVFLGANGNAAEMRNIGGRKDTFAKMNAKGSDKDSGGFVIAAEKDFNEKQVTAVEGCTDSLSYHAIYPGRVVMSCMGVSFELAAATAIEVLINDLTFNLSFDNDNAGNLASVMFEKLLIEEFGEEEYNQFLISGKLQYFALGIEEFKNTIAKGETFYFDLKQTGNDDAEKCAKLFHKQLILHSGIDREELKNIVLSGKAKYINIFPDLHIFPDNLVDAEKEVSQYVDLLSGNKPYYMRVIEPQQKEDIEEENIKLSNRFNLFQTALHNVSQNKLPLLEKQGKIIYHKPKMHKDWNEYLISKYKTDLSFKQHIDNIETKITKNSKTKNTPK